jgi:hypothetical protein
MAKTNSLNTRDAYAQSLKSLISSGNVSQARDLLWVLEVSDAYKSEKAKHQASRNQNIDERNERKRKEEEKRQSKLREAIRVGEIHKEEMMRRLSNIADWTIIADIQHSVICEPVFHIIDLIKFSFEWDFFENAVYEFHINDYDFRLQSDWMFWRWDQKHQNQRLKNAIWYTDSWDDDRDNLLSVFYLPEFEKSTLRNPIKYNEFPWIIKIWEYYFTQGLDRGIVFSKNKDKLQWNWKKS